MDTAWVPVPGIEEISAEDEFEAWPISGDEFEHVWRFAAPQS